MREGYTPSPPEKTKKLNIDFFLAPHGEAQDISHLAEHFSQADVLVLESLHYSQQIEDIHNMVSRGEVSPEQLQADPLTTEILKIIFNTKKPVLLVDIPSGSPEDAKINEFDSDRKQARKEGNKLFYDGKFDESLEKRKTQVGVEFQEKEFRESYILNALQTKIESFKKAHPEIENPDDLKILAHYGRAHLSLFRKAQQAGLAEVRHMNSRVSVLLSEDEILNRKFLGKEADNYLYARIILENFVFLAMQKKPNLNNDQANWLTRKIVDGLNLDDIKEISNRMGQQTGTTDKFKALNQFLQKKNVVIPSTEEEMKIIMGSDWEIFRKMSSQVNQ